MKFSGLLAVLLLFFTIINCVYSTDITEGKIKLCIDEKQGSFIPYYLDNINTGKYIPLLFDKDPETTFLSIMVDNKIYKMGNTSLFANEFFLTSSGAEIVWTSTVLKITESFSFLKSKEASLSDGFKITITVENISDNTNYIGIAYLFDTYLGEEQDSHFITNTGTQITSENSYSRNFPAYWISPSKDTNVLGLQGMVRGSGITVPGKIIFANWKRLKDNLWNFTVRKSRNFNLIPYSINDSAIAFIFDPTRIESHSKRTIVIAMGGYTNSSFSAAESINNSGIDTLFDKTLITEQDPQNTETSVKTDFIAVTDLLTKIDNYLEYPDNITQSEIDLIKQILETLKQRKTLYENR